MRQEIIILDIILVLIHQNSLFGSLPASKLTTYFKTYTYVFPELPEICYFTNIVTQMG